MGVAPSETWRRRDPGDCGSPSRTIELNPSRTAQHSAHLNFKSRVGTINVSKAEIGSLLQSLCRDSDSYRMHIS